MTRPVVLRWWLLPALLALVACGAPAPAGRPLPPPPEDTGSLEAFLAELQAADNAGDLEAVVACYAEDAILLPPGESPVVGRMAIAARYRDIFASSTLVVAFHLEETRSVDDWGFARGRTEGRVTPREGGAPKPIQDEFLMTLERGADGSWRISRLIWSPAAPGG